MQDPLAWAKKNLASPDKRLRQAARRYLAFRGKEVQSFLVEATRARDWRVREGAVLVFSWSRLFLPLREMKRLEKDPSWPVRCALADYLGGQGYGEKVLRRLASDPFHDVRARAILGLGAMGSLDPETAGRAWKDRSYQVRAAAARTMVFGFEPPSLPGPPETYRPYLEEILRALALRPSPGHRPWLEPLLGKESGSSLLEKLLALQVLRPLGSIRAGDAALVLRGLSSPDPRLKAEAVQAGRFLSGREVRTILAEGLRIPGRDGLQGFLSLAERHGSDLAGDLAKEMVKLFREREGALWGARVFLASAGLSPGEGLGRALLDAEARESAFRLRLAGGLALAAGAPRFQEWLLGLLRKGVDPPLRNRLLPLLLPFAGKEDVAAFLVSLLPGMKWWRRRPVLKALVREAGGRPVPSLLVLLEEGRIRDGRPLADYLEAIRDYPATARYRAILRKVLSESQSPRARLQAARNLARRRKFLTREDLDAMERAASTARAGRALMAVCFEALAAGGRWKEVEGILSRLPEKDARPFRVDLARLAGRNGWKEALPVLERWAGAGGDPKVELEALLALAALGREDAFERLIPLSSSAGELTVDRIAGVFARAPSRLARKAFLLWSAPGAPAFLQEAACRLAGETAGAAREKELSCLLEKGKSISVKGAAAAALLLRGEASAVEAVLGSWIFSREGLLEEMGEEDRREFFREIMGVLPKVEPDWGPSFLWEVLFDPFIQDPLGAMERESGSWFGPGRAGLSEARIYGRILFTFPEDLLRKALSGVLSLNRRTLGRGLLGKGLLSNLIHVDTSERDLPFLPGLCGDLAKLVLQLAPRGGMPDFYALLFLGRRAEKEGRLEKGAGFYERALREGLMGTLSYREAEMVLGETDPAGGVFPLARLAARPLLLEARLALKSGEWKEGLALVSSILARGGADRKTRSQALELKELFLKRKG